MDGKDTYDELCFSFKKISEKEKMETAKQTGLVEFKTIETDLFKGFTYYIQLTQKHAMSTVLGSYTDETNFFSNFFSKSKVPIFKSNFGWIVCFL